MTTITRNTKYSQAALEFIRASGHVTNSQIVDELRSSFPELSATTVHRVTARLCERGLIAHAPSTESGCMQYDGNVSPHHHFYCAHCKTLRDINLDSTVVDAVEATLGGCKLSGSLYIQGSCGGCVEAEKSKGGIS